MPSHALPIGYVDEVSDLLAVDRESVYNPKTLYTILGPRLQAMHAAEAAIANCGDHLSALAPDRDGRRPDPATAIRTLYAALGDAKMEALLATRKAEAAEKALADVNSDIRYLAGQIPRLGPNAEGVYPTPMRALDIVVHLLDEAYDQLRGAKADARRMAAECAALDAKAAHYRERTDHLLFALRRLSRAYTALLATI
jgi:hypothetical protein